VTAVVFDLDGVLVDSEQIWDDARRRIVERRGGTWRPEATRAMMGMNAPEWSRYLHDQLAVPDTPAAITEAVVAVVLDSYRQNLPLLPGAVNTVRTLADRWPLGLASSANRVVIDAFLDGSGLRDCFRVVLSSEEVPRGKPAPDVYLAVLDALGVDPRSAVAVEDSANGIRAAIAARTWVVAIPNRTFPPPRDVLAMADVMLKSLTDLTPELVEDLVAPDGRR
jgi:HAD superfamily hydrolase (TIGR01509 family)